MTQLMTKPSQRFLMKTVRSQSELPFGKLAWLSGPKSCGAKELVVMEIDLIPGAGHSFHYHEGQEELIYVLEGRIEQWLEQECRILGKGDAIVLPPGAIHASFNSFDQPARVLAIIGPCVGEDGYKAFDVFDHAPYNTWRPSAKAVSHAR